MTVPAALAFILISGLSQPASSDHSPALSCGDTYYGDYHPRVPLSLDEVAPKARERLQAFLLNRLGREAAGRLRFAGGQIVDREQLRRQDPDSINYQWTPPKYNLKFIIPIGADDAGACGSVEMDESGVIMKDIALPHFKDHPERLVMASADEATTIARKNGVPRNARGELQYFLDSDTLEWVFTFIKSERHGEITLANFHVVTHDTRQTHWTETTAIR